MSEIESVINFSKRIETLLVSKFQADGRGLHAKLNSVQVLLPEALVKRIRWIATIRNNLVHDEHFQLESLEDFEKSCSEAIEELKSLQGLTAKPGAQMQLSPMEEPKESNTDAPAQAEPKPVLEMPKPAIAPKSKHSSKFTNIPHKSYSDNLAGYLVTLFVLIVLGIVGWFNQTLLINWYNRYVNSSAATQAQISPELKLAYEDIDTNIFEYMKANTKTWLDQQQLLKNKSGTYDVQVMLHWSVPGESLGKALNQYFGDATGTPIKPRQIDLNQDQQSSLYGIAVGNHINLSTEKPFSKEILDYLSKHQVAIKVSVGSHAKYIIIASGRQCDKTCIGVGHDQYQFHLSNNSNAQRLMLNSDPRQSNPVIIKGLTEADFKNEKSIKTSIEILPVADSKGIESAAN